MNRKGGNQKNAKKDNIDQYNQVSPTRDVERGVVASRGGIMTQAPRPQTAAAVVKQEEIKDESNPWAFDPFKQAPSKPVKAAAQPSKAKQSQPAPK